PPPAPAGEQVEGWKMVPVVPTEAMRDAAANHYGYSGYVETYRAMLAAAPAAPVGVDLGNWAAHYSIGPAALEALRGLLALSTPAPVAPVGVDERVRGIIALLRQPEPDNGEKRTEHDEGYEQASSEIADMLAAALVGKDGA